MVYVTLGATLTAVVAIIAVALIGLWVTTRYPDVSDPKRSARRFTVPAALLVCLAVVSAIVALIGLALVLAGIR